MDSRTYVATSPTSYVADTCFQRRFRRRHEKCKTNETTRIVKHKPRRHLLRTSQIPTFCDVFEDVTKSVAYLTEFIQQFLNSLIIHSQSKFLREKWRKFEVAKFCRCRCRLLLRTAYCRLLVHCTWSFFYFYVINFLYWTHLMYYFIS